MTTATSVLVIGFVPELVDFSAFPGMNAEKVRAGTASSIAKLQAQGYLAEQCFVDFGETAETVVSERLAAGRYSHVVFGAGIRTSSAQVALFERLIDLVRVKAPQAKICFNTNPTDTADAIQRWV